MTLIVYYDPDSLYIKLLHMILMVSDYEVNLLNMKPKIAWQITKANNFY